MSYKILSWIPVEEEDLEEIESFEEASEELNHLQELQPENIYKIMKVDKDGGLVDVDRSE